MTASVIHKFKLTQQNGYFAHLHDCVLLAKAAAAKNARPYFFLAGKMHAQPGLSHNYFSYYFTHHALTREERRECYRSVVSGEDFIEIRDRYDINSYWCGDRLAEISNTIKTLEEGRSLFASHLVVKHAIASVCDRFWHEHFHGKRVLGVHFRGTDKPGPEADAVPFSEMLDVIEGCFHSRLDAIFLATDDHDFFEFVTASPLRPYVCWFQAPQEQKPLWLPSRKNFRKGAEAILDCLLLSRCAVLIKTPSLLSSWCKVFRPELELVLVGKPFNRPYGEPNLDGPGYWPERCLWPSSPPPSEGGN